MPMKKVLPIDRICIGIHLKKILYQLKGIKEPQKKQFFVTFKALKVYAKCMRK